ncbi:MAG: aminotransferase class III-fold pyridoxal phosphate-dependent enzyme [Myxococcales bacterium]|nr:aminotransferase class III-fold pyridoxal phosphate-dependent enzyme [Myxococcales bacterium]
MSHLLDTLGPAKLPVTFVSGEGALLWDVDGHTWWDFYGGHATALLGQGHPRWVEALTTQANGLSFMTTLADVPVRTRAARALCAFTGLDRAFFVNSGAEANEAALKVARKATGRPVVVAMAGGFHGRTMGAVGVTQGHRHRHLPAHGDVRFVPFGDLPALIEALDDDVAAVITEPIQGTAGVVEPPMGWLAGVKAAANRAGALLIADEVQSGMGRVGAPLASTQQGVSPDIVTLGKSLGAGFPVAAMLCTEAVAATAAPGDHGTTFGGAPLACAAVEATLQILHDEELMVRAQALGSRMQKLLATIRGVVGVRGRGVWIGLVLDRPAAPVAQALRQEHFLVGTSADPTVLRLSPPAVLPPYAIDALAEALQRALHTHTSALQGAA